jgi:AcrR family transcriptional regulator
MARPRVFDVDKAIDIATDLFRRNGYERTSLADLTSAIGITPPSFYFAFDSKAGLFKKVLEHYFNTYLAGVEKKALSKSRASEVVSSMLYGLADLYTDKAHPPGCLAVKCAQPCSDDSDVGEVMKSFQEARRKRISGRLRIAQANGDLAAEADPDELAKFVLVVGWGLGVDAHHGASRADLHRTVRIALRAWPS